MSDHSSHGSIKEVRSIESIEKEKCGEKALRRSRSRSRSHSHIEVIEPKGEGRRRRIFMAIARANMLSMRGRCPASSVLNFRSTEHICTSQVVFLHDCFNPCGVTFELSRCEPEPREHQKYGAGNKFFTSSAGRPERLDRLYQHHRYRCWAADHSLWRTSYEAVSFHVYGMGRQHLTSDWPDWNHHHRCQCHSHRRVAVTQVVHRTVN